MSTGNFRKGGGDELAGNTDLRVNSPRPGPDFQFFIIGKVGPFNLRRIAFFASGKTVITFGTPRVIIVFGGETRRGARLPGWKMLNGRRSDKKDRYHP